MRQFKNGYIHVPVHGATTPQAAVKAVWGYKHDIKTKIESWLMSPNGDGLDVFPLPVMDNTWRQDVYPEDGELSLRVVAWYIQPGNPFGLTEGLLVAILTHLPLDYLSYGAGSRFGYRLGESPYGYDNTSTPSHNPYTDQAPTEVGGNRPMHELYMLPPPLFISRSLPVDYRYSMAW